MIPFPFSGSALTRLDTAGRLSLPGFVRETLNRRGGAGNLLVGSHESDPCLVAYDRSFASVIFADVERRRLSELSVAPHLHHARARRTFGFVQAAEVEAGGIILPPPMRRRARIGKLALLIGVGGTFEIWDAEAALEKGDADLRELAAFYLDIQHAA